MFQRVFALFLLLVPSVVWGQAPPSPAPLQVLYFPHFAVGGGTEYNGFRLVDGYEFGLILDNPNSTKVSLVIDWWGSDGKNFVLKTHDGGDGEKLIDTARIQISLPSLAATEETFSLPSSTVKTGWIKIEVWGTASPNIFLQFRRKVAGAVVGQATVMPSPLAKKLRFYAKKYSSAGEDPSETGLAIANPNNVAVNLAFTYRDRVGNQFADIRRTLPPMSQEAIFISQIFPLADDFEGSLEISSDQPVAGVALQTTGDDKTFNFSTISLVALP